MKKTVAAAAPSSAPETRSTPALPRSFDAQSGGCLWLRRSWSAANSSCAARCLAFVARSSSSAPPAEHRGGSSESASKKRTWSTQPPTDTKGGTMRWRMRSWAKSALDMDAEKDPTNARHSRLRAPATSPSASAVALPSSPVAMRRSGNWARSSLDVSDASAATSYLFRSNDDSTVTVSKSAAHAARGSAAESLTTRSSRKP